jgi:hypothetical protein
MTRQAQAVVYSGTQDISGHYNVTFSDTPWCDGACWVLNPNPRLQHPTGTFTKASLNIAGAPLTKDRDQPDGEYLDSLEAHADVLDYRLTSLQMSNLALTFATDDPLHPTLPTWFSVYEAESSLSDELHAHAKLLMANTVPWRFSAFAPNLDVLGTETNMFNDDGSFAPDSDAIMNLRRTSAYHKPYLLLLNTDFSKVSESGIELYFERCLFYGIYPSMFSADADSNPYWQNPQFYNRDRPLFKTYIPLIRTLSQAGWQPVTLAHSSNPNIWIERYGSKYFTILNPTDRLQSTAITIDSRLQNPTYGHIELIDVGIGQQFADMNITLQPLQSELLVAQNIADLNKTKTN